MSNIITVSAYREGTTPPSKQHNIGVAQVLDIVDYSDSTFPFIKSVVTQTIPYYRHCIATKPQPRLKQQLTRHWLNYSPLSSGRGSLNLTSDFLLFYIVAVEVLNLPIGQPYYPNGIYH
jgi:hypothetical protein